MGSGLVGGSFHLPSLAVYILSPYTDTKLFSPGRNVLEKAILTLNLVISIRHTETPVYIPYICNICIGIHIYPWRETDRLMIDT